MLTLSVNPAISAPILRGPDQPRFFEVGTWDLGETKTTNNPKTPEQVENQTKP